MGKAVLVCVFFALLATSASALPGDGGPGPDVIHGRGGDDIINGGGGSDRLYGDAGRDIVSADRRDTVTGCERVRPAADGRRRTSRKCHERLTARL